ncbi:MAG: AarF/UbiB family protein [Pirellulaceae bacterium]|nr:AarF/UbiB family protein [Pirellulaceae bacterium]
MKISTIPQLYRNLRRWQEIIVILRRYGLADWLSQLRVDFIRDWIKDEQGVPLASYSRSTRIRMALTDLGPTFIKLGQVLSLRPDLIGIELANELTQLQSEVPADAPQQVRELVEKSLGRPISEAYAEFDDVAIASASIGQVHRAKLHDGTAVVVKVQHAGIEAKVNEDMEVMAGLAMLAERIPELAAWKPQVLVEQLSRSLKRELNFSRELQNLQNFSRALVKFKGVRIPRSFPELSASRVLTMEYIEGIAVNKLTVEAASNDQRQAIAKLAAEVYVEMIFTLGAYHADPHPGNILVVNGNELGLLDFGMVGRIDDRLRESIEEMLLAVLAQDVSMLATLIKRVGSTPPRLDDSLLSIDVADMVANYGSQSLENFDLAGALNDMTDIMHRHQISLPPQTSLLIKMLVTLEGTLHQLAPKFSLIEVMQPFFRRMWIRRLSPKRQAKRFRRVYFELEALLETLPGQVSSVMQLIQEGRLDVHLAHKGLSPSVNRLVLGILISSVFLGSSMLLAYQVPPLLFMEPVWFGVERLSLFGLLGYALSMMVGLRLVMAINRSGHLDKEDSD